MNFKLNITSLILKAKKAYAFFAFIFLITNFNAQINLITNPSFELSTGIPQGFGEINKSQNWYSVFGTPDYYSKFSPAVYSSTNCSVNSLNNWIGNQIPKTGDFYCGITLRSLFPSSGYPLFSNYFEIIGNKLVSQLKKDHIYDFNLYYSCAEGSGKLNNQLSAYFSPNKFSISNLTFSPLNKIWYDTTINNKNPQINHDTSAYLINDTLSWQKLQGCFLADGTEQYVSIGNFRDGSFNKVLDIPTSFSFPCSGETLPNKCYIYIDDVSLYDIGYYSGNAQCKDDTIICFNSSIVIGKNIKDSSVIAWQPHPSLSCTNCPNPIATPTITTKYYVTKTLCSFITKDSITVSVFTPSVNANAGIDKQLCFNQSSTLGTKDSTNFTNYFWQPNQFINCNNCATPISNPNTSITYTLQKTECGIISKDSVRIISEDCETSYEIPNIFTPNGDNVNETWGINFSQTKYIKNFSLTIYNRWGALILLSEKPNLKWDGHTTSGEVCSDGVYFYIITFELNGEQKTFKGNVTLLK